MPATTRSASKPKSVVPQQPATSAAKKRPCEDRMDSASAPRDDGLVDSPRQKQQPQQQHSSSGEEFRRQAPSNSQEPGSSGSPREHGADDAEEDDEDVLKAHIDAKWAPSDLADLDTDAIITAEVEAEVRAYEAEVGAWRMQREQARKAGPAAQAGQGALVVTSKRHDGDESSEHDEDGGDVVESKADFLRRTGINNPKGKFTFDTLVANVLPPEVHCLGGDAIAEAMVQLRIVRLESMAMEDTETLECLDAVTHLYLSDNRLRNLNGLEYLERLKVLVVSGNQLTSLLAIAGLELDLLDVRHNRISHLEEDGVPVLPLTVKRLYLEGNPCVPDRYDDASEYSSYVDTVKACCPELEVLDDETIVDAAAADDGEAQGMTKDANGDEGVDFDLEEEEARFAANASNSSEVPHSRYALPVGGGMSSQVRSVTDDLLRRYEKEVEEKMRAVQRADDAATIGGLTALREHQQLEHEAKQGHDGTSGSRPSTASNRRPTSASARGLTATDRPSSALAHRTQLTDTTTADNGDGEGDDSDGSDDPDEDEALTGVRPHADTVNRQHELQRELRFAMGHQCNVAVSRLNDMWDHGADQLRTLRDARQARAETSSQANANHSRGYERALERIRDYTGKHNLDKYLVEAPAKANAIEPPRRSASRP
jgi:hypothetical protein